MEAIGNTLKQTARSLAHEELRLQIQRQRDQLLTYKCQVAMDYEPFKELLVTYATQILLKRSVNTAYVVDNNNGPIIKQLYYYFTNNPLCKWNLNAGLIFGGNIGCGKSVLMMAYIELSNNYSRRITQTVHSKTLGSKLKEKGMDYYVKRPLFIDELGREEMEVRDFGNVIKPVIDLFALRYEAGARTYATTNYNFDDLESIYKSYIVSRVSEMMTLVPIPGENRRLTNQVKK